jgi:hypothetical protein
VGGVQVDGLDMLHAAFSSNRAGSKLAVVILAADTTTLLVCTPEH